MICFLITCKTCGSKYLKDSISDLKEFGTYCPECYESDEHHLIIETLSLNEFEKQLKVIEKEMQDKFCVESEYHEFNY